MRYDLTDIDTGFSQKKQINLIFVMFDVLFSTQELFWINAGLKEFLWMNKRPYLIISICNYVFHDFGYKFVSKKKSKLLHTFAFFSFLSTFYLVSLINGQIERYRCLKKAQKNIF